MNAPRKSEQLKILLKEDIRKLGLNHLLDRIDTFNIGQITKPSTDGSRKRNIDDPYNAYVNNRPYTINVRNAKFVNRLKSR